MSDSFKQKASETLCKSLTDYIDERYQEDVARNQAAKLLESNAFKTLQTSEKIQKFNKFAANMMLDIGIRVYREERETVHSKVRKEVAYIFDSLFTEEESQQIYEFCKSEVGMKLLRNLDLFRESYTEALMDLMVKTYQAYSNPDFTGLMTEYLKQLDEIGDDDVED